MHDIFDMYEVLSKPEERSDESYRLCYMLKARVLFFSSETRMLSLICLTPCVTDCHNLQSEATQLLAVRVDAIVIPIFVSCPFLCTAQQGFLARNELWKTFLLQNMNLTISSCSMMRFPDFVFLMPLFFS